MNKMISESFTPHCFTQARPFIYHSSLLFFNQEMRIYEGSCSTSGFCVLVSISVYLMLPTVEKTNRVKEPESTCITRSLYFRFFSFSCFFSILCKGAVICEAALAFVTRMSKYAFCPRRQKPRHLLTLCQSILRLPQIHFQMRKNILID